MPDYYRGGPPVPASQIRGGDLIDVINTILDKGLVIDVIVRVKLLGLELLGIDARIIVSSVDTYLRLADAAARMRDEHGYDVVGPLAGAEKGQTLGEFVGDTVGGIGEGVEQVGKGVGGAKGRGKGRGIGTAAKEAVEAFKGDEKDEEKQPVRRRRTQ